MLQKRTFSHRPEGRFEGESKMNQHVHRDSCSLLPGPTPKQFWPRCRAHNLLGFVFLSPDMRFSETI